MGKRTEIEMTPIKKQLTLLEASAIVAGLGVGGGIMAVPYLAALNGLTTIVIILIVSYMISLLLHLMVAEVVLHDEEPRQLVEIFGKYLFTKTWRGGLLMWLFFGLIAVTFYALLAAYVEGCGDILREQLSIPKNLGSVLTYGLSAGVVFFGLKAIGFSEKWAIIAICALVLILSVGTLTKPLHHIPVVSGNAKTALAFYGMMMLSFACFFSIPQAAEGLLWNKKLVPWAVATGLAINLAFVFIITLMAMLASKEVTEIAIIGWGQAIGPWANVLGSFFAFLAMITSYWAVSYALAIIIVERIGWNYKLSWFVTTSPTLVLALIGLASFQEYLRYAGGAMAVLVAMLIVPALRKSRKYFQKPEPAFRMGKWGGTFFQIIVIIAYALMALGSLVKYK